MELGNLYQTAVHTEAAPLGLGGRANPRDERDTVYLSS
jgi:hypothetical protein